MFIDAAVIAALIYCFARYNAEGGFLRSFLMLLGVIIVAVLIIVVLPPLRYFLLPIFVILLAAGLTFICGTQPRQTGKIIGVFLLYRLVMWGIPALIKSSGSA